MNTKVELPEEKTASLALKGFIWQGNFYVYAKPAKTLFHSSMIYEVITRGDIFAVRVSDGILTIVPGTAQVLKCEIDLATAITREL